MPADLDLRRAVAPLLPGRPTHGSTTWYGSDTGLTWRRIDGDWLPVLDDGAVGVLLLTLGDRLFQLQRWSTEGLYSVVYRGADGRPAWDGAQRDPSLPHALARALVAAGGSDDA